MGAPPFEPVAAAPALTLDELLQYEGRAEILDGELVEMSASGSLQQFIISNIVELLAPYARQHRLGRVFGDGFTYLMFAQSPRLKDSFEPDVSFLSKDNVPADWDVEKPHPGAPDFAVEVISPDDRADRIWYKTRTYLEKGTRQVWQVYPRSREIHVYVTGASKIYSGDTAIDLNDIFPGLPPLALKTIFELPDWLVQQTVQPDQSA